MAESREGMKPHSGVEPWLRGSYADMDALRRQVLHALELSAEDCDRWCTPLTAAEIQSRPFGLPSVVFHLRHIIRSLDRLLTYAEDRPLTEAQLAALQQEATEAGQEMESAESLFNEFYGALGQAASRVRALNPDEYELARHVGRERLPTTLGALLVHCAEHTQRHAGQMVTTARLNAALRTVLQP